MKFPHFRSNIKLFKNDKFSRDKDNKGFLNEIILESLNESEREKEQILNSLMEQISYLDLDYKIKWVNEAGLKNLPVELSISDVLGKPCYTVWYNRKTPCESCPVSTTIKTGWPWKEEIEHIDGTTKLISSQPVHDDNETLIGIIESEIDITLRKDVERALEKSQHRSRALLDAIPDMLIVFNNSGKFLDYHPGADFDLLTTDSNLEGKYLTEIMPAGLSEEIVKQSKALVNVGIKRNFEFNTRVSGENLFYDCRVIKTGTDENVCIIQDISVQKHREKDILIKSFHDSLTGLYNRSYFEEELKRLENSRHTFPVSILVVDVDGLKFTNDAFGHDFGDKLLKKVSSILASNCRKEDVIARLGGDEFAIILPGSPLIKAEILSKRILEACRTSKCDDFFARPSVSIGCATQNDDSVSLSDIIKKADENMYRMKLENRSAHLNTLTKDILSSINKYSYESEEHLTRCSTLSEKFIRTCNISNVSIENLQKLSMLHDIGKIRIPGEILSKKTPLSEIEFSEIKKHPIIGYRIIKALPDYASIANLILYHHEHWDGSGYPSGLAGKEIPLICRIFNIVEAFELITNGNIYRKARSIKDAVFELEENAGKQFDPDLVKKFIDFITKESLN